MKRSKTAKRSRKAAKKKRSKPDDKEAATTFVPVAIPKPVENPVTATLNTAESPIPTTSEPSLVTSAPDQSEPVVS